MVLFFGANTVGLSPVYQVLLYLINMSKLFIPDVVSISWLRFECSTVLTTMTAISGSEAMFADLGHFSYTAIQVIFVKT